MSKAGFDPLKDSVVDGVREATAPPPLVNYDGYLMCNISVDGKPCMIGEEAYVDATDQNLIAEIKIVPQKPSMGAWSRLVVNQGVELPRGPAEAIFDVEANADDIQVPIDIVRLRAAPGGSSSQERIPLQISEDANTISEITLKLFVSQAGRHINVLKIPIKRRTRKESPRGARKAMNAKARKEVVVVSNSNNEKELSHSFLRRCFFHGAARPSPWRALC